MSTDQIFATDIRHYCYVSVKCGDINALPRQLLTEAPSRDTAVP